MVAWHWELPRQVTRQARGAFLLQGPGRENPGIPPAPHSQKTASTRGAQHSVAAEVMFPGYHSSSAIFLQAEWGALLADVSGCRKL